MGEYRFQRGNGEYLYILDRALIERDAKGAAVRAVCLMMDVTARKQMQAQACRSQRMEAFGQLAGGVAHDFNNFLTTILGYSDLILSEAGSADQLAAPDHGDPRRRRTGIHPNESIARLQPAPGARADRARDQCLSDQS